MLTPAIVGVSPFPVTVLSPHRMAEPRFNNPYFWPPPPTMPSQVRLLQIYSTLLPLDGSLDGGCHVGGPGVPEGVWHCTPACSALMSRL